MKSRAEEFPGTESQNHSILQENQNRKEKRPYLNKIVKKFSPSKNQNKLKNFNNQNNVSAKLNPFVYKIISSTRRIR